MTKRIVLLVILAHLATIVPSRAGDNHPPYVGSKELERMKTWAGNWAGTHTMGDKTDPAAVQYYVTSNGSVVVEKLFPGAPHEMITVYHDRKSKLAMTHYCAVGNRPLMTLTNASDTQLEFVVADGGEVDVATEAHMHALTLSSPSPDTLIQRWTYFEGGKPTGTTVIELQRTK